MEIVNSDETFVMYKTSRVGVINFIKRHGSEFSVADEKFWWVSHLFDELNKLIVDTEQLKTWELHGDIKLLKRIDTKVFNLSRKKFLNLYFWSQCDFESFIGKNENYDESKLSTLLINEGIRETRHNRIRNMYPEFSNVKLDSKDVFSELLVKTIVIGWLIRYNCKI